MPKGIRDERKKHNPHYPWKECISSEGVKYYWNQETNETLWDVPWSEGPAKGKRYGRWTECVGPDGAYFWDELTGEVNWEIPTDEEQEIKNSLEEIKANKRSSQGQVVGSSAPTSKRASVVMRDKQLADIKHERSLLSREKEELEKLRAEILQLKQCAITPSSVSVKFAPDTAIPSAPKTAPPQNRCSSAILGKSSAGLTIADGFSTTQNTRDNHGINPGSNVSPGYEVNGKSLHTAHSSKSLRGKGKQKNKSNFAKKHKGPTLAKAFFPEKQGCDCCHGYIYGCDEMVCQELGKCICSLEEGEGTGDVKKKKVREFDG